MSEYQRFVSYIYLYDKGIKVKNSGFAKIECKDNILRIKMNLKGVFNNYYEKWNVFLLLEEGNELLGLQVGEVKGKGTNAEFQMVGSTENLNNTTESFQDVKGLAVISSTNKKYATFWKDTDITIENFIEYEEAKAKKPKNILNFSAQKKKKEELLEAMSVEKEEEQKQKEISSKQEKIGVAKKEESKQESKENVKETLQELENEQVQQQEALPKEMPEVSLEDNWNKLTQEYKNLKPFAENDIECIRIELKDLRILPQSQWVLSSNSFVLHGFYNYQYLILGKINDKFILGVPGIFCNKDKLVASLFGFHDFKPAQVSEYKTGRFGYWYKYL